MTTEAEAAAPSTSAPTRQRTRDRRRSSGAGSRVLAAEPSISLRTCRFYYGAFRAVKDVTIDVPEPADHRAHRPVRAAARPRCCARSTA